MKFLLITLFSLTGFFNAPQAHDLEPMGRTRVCVYILGKPVICVGVEESFTNAPEEIRTEGQADMNRNMLTISDFPKEMNGRSLKITKGENLFKMQKGDQFIAYLLKPGDYSIRDGKTFIPFSVGPGQ